MTWRISEAELAAAGLAAVIFDLDGVLVTTDHFHYLGWKRLADELGMHFNETDNHKLRGVSREESLKIIYKINKRPLPAGAEFRRQMTVKNNYYNEFIKQMQPQDILPGSVELLKALRAAGIKCAVASSSKNAGTVVKYTALNKYIDTVTDGNSITASKPDPEVFLLAACTLRVLPWNCIGVEDAAAGITSIKRAGMVSIGIGAQAREGDLAVDSVKELTAGRITDLFKQKKMGRNREIEKLFLTLNKRVNRPS